MGLFDFVSNAGNDAAGDLTKDAEVSQERIDGLRQSSISDSLAALDIEGEQVSVSVAGDVATLTGSAPSQEALEKMVLCAGNQHGIAKVDCQLEVDAPPPPPEPEPAAASAEAAAAPLQPPIVTAEAPSTFYTVQAGDTLGKIAKQHYGDAGKYTLIFEANKPMLADPDKIYPGQSLRIPPL